MTDYYATRASFSIDIPGYFNFGSDVIDASAARDRNKLTMIWVSQTGEKRKYTFKDSSNLSDQAANILLKYGINKGDCILIMLPQFPEWWIIVVALIKLGAVFCPYPTSPEENIKIVLKADGTIPATYRDRDGYFWFVGRHDDVIKSSGHRIGTVRGRERPRRTPVRPGGGRCRFTGPDPRDDRQGIRRFKNPGTNLRSLS